MFILAMSQEAANAQKNRASKNWLLNKKSETMLIHFADPTRH
jgi:hypothetical protein